MNTDDQAPVLQDATKPTLLSQLQGLNSASKGKLLLLILTAIFLGYVAGRQSSSRTDVRNGLVIDVRSGSEKVSGGAKGSAAISFDIAMNCVPEVLLRLPDNLAFPVRVEKVRKNGFIIESSPPAELKLPTTTTIQWWAFCR